MAESMNDFYEMFEASMKPIHNGDMLEGTIVEVGAEAAILDLQLYGRNSSGRSTGERRNPE